MYESKLPKKADPVKQIENSVKIVVPDLPHYRKQFYLGMVNNIQE